MNTLKKTIDGIDFYSDGRIIKNGKEFGVYDHCGYKKICFKSNSKSAHRMLYEIFVGKIDKGLEIDHINGIRDDNRIENLELVTHKENIRRAAARGSYRNNKLRSGENHGRSILDDMKVLTIRTMGKNDRYGRGDCYTDTELSIIFKVSKTRIGKIRNNKEWKHLPDAS